MLDYIILTLMVLSIVIFVVFIIFLIVVLVLKPNISNPPIYSAAMFSDSNYNMYLIGGVTTDGAITSSSTERYLEFSYNQNIYKITIKGIFLDYKQTMIVGPNNTTSLIKSGIYDVIGYSLIRKSFTVFTIGNIIYFFGGIDNYNNLYNDVLSFNVANLFSGTITQIIANTSANTSPSQRYGSSGAQYDANNFIIYGGIDINGNYLNDLWTFNIPNTTWAQLNPLGISPTASVYNTMSVVNTNLFILIGGFNGTNILNNVYQYNKTSNGWTDITANFTLSPPQIDGQTTIYNSISDQMIIFGGYDGTTYYNTLWNFDLTSNLWIQLIPSGSSPSVRNGSCAIYIRSTNQMIIFGGYNGTTYFNDLWSYNIINNVWSKLNPSSGTLPDIRSGACSIYDSLNNQMIIFGGYNGNVYLNDTWSYNINSNTWKNLNPSGTVPGTRGYATAIYSISNITLLNQMIIFGGYNAIIALNQLWSFNIVNNTWSQLIPSGTLPTGVYGCGSVYLNNNQMMIFGGFDDTIDYNNLWSYNISTNLWSLVSITNSPIARSFLSMVLTNNNEIVIFGGINHTSSLFFNDIWGTNLALGEGWVQLVPFSQYGHTAITNNTNNIYVFGGLSSDGTEKNNIQVYNFNNNTLSNYANQNPIPDGRHFHSSVFVNGSMFTFGGLNGNSPLNDFWQYNIGPNTWNKLS